jgi:hypothetical protein
VPHVHHQNRAGPIFRGALVRHLVLEAVVEDYRLAVAVLVEFGFRVSKGLMKPGDHNIASRFSKLWVHWILFNIVQPHLALRPPPGLAAHRD